MQRQFRVDRVERIELLALVRGRKCLDVARGDRRLELGLQRIAPAIDGRDVDGRKARVGRRAGAPRRPACACRPCP